MNTKQTLNFAQWVLIQQSHLESLYNDFQKDANDNKTNFFDFCLFMFKETRHYFNVAPMPTNLIEIRVVCTSGIVQNVYSNVNGRRFDVDVIDTDIQDEALADKAKAEALKLDDTHHKIF